MFLYEFNNICMKVNILIDNSLRADLIMVPMSGLEPLSREAGDFESPMYTIPSHRQIKTL